MRYAGSRLARSSAVVAALLVLTLVGGACGSDTEQEEAEMAVSSGATQFEQTGIWGDDPAGVQFAWPNGLTLDSDDNVYSTDFQGGHIRKFTPDGELLWESGGDGSAPGQMSNPIGAAVADDGVVYVSESGNSRVSVFGPDGTFQATWGQAGSEPGQFQSAMGIDVSSAGEVFVADFGNNRVQVFDSDGNYLRHWGQTGAGPGDFNNPIGVRIGPGGDVWVVDSKNARIQIFSPNGEVLRVFDEVGGGPEIISVNDGGDFFVSSPWVDGEVKHFSADGEFLGTLVTGLEGLHGTATGKDGVVYVAQTADNVIRLFTQIDNG